MSKKKGFLITFEGPEGSGKSTQSKLLGAWLCRQGYPVLLTREPGGTRLGQQLRRILLDHRSSALSPLVELCLYEASRAILVSEVIRPALKVGQIVIIDRFQDSTMVYQGMAGGLGTAFVREIGRSATEGLTPNLTILLDLPAEKGLSRVKNPNRIEAKPLSFHRAVRRGYCLLAHREPKRFRVIRADRPLDEVQQKIRKEVRDLLR